METWTHSLGVGRSKTHWGKHPLILFLKVDGCYNCRMWRHINLYTKNRIQTHIMTNMETAIQRTSTNINIHVPINHQHLQRHKNNHATVPYRFKIFRRLSIQKSRSSPTSYFVDKLYLTKNLVNIRDIPAA